MCTCDRPLLHTSRPAGAWPVHLGHMGDTDQPEASRPQDPHTYCTQAPLLKTAANRSQSLKGPRGALWSVWKQVPRAEPRKFYLPQRPLSAWGSSLESRKGTDAGWEPPAPTQTRRYRSCTHAQGSDQGSQVLGAVGRLHSDGQAPSQVPHVTPLPSHTRGANLEGSQQPPSRAVGGQLLTSASELSLRPPPRQSRAGL